MDSIKKFLFYTLLILSTGLIIITLLSLFKDLKLWYFKILDFPRLQYFLLGLLFSVLLVFSIKKWKVHSFFLAFGLLAVISIHGMVIFPYWFGEKLVPDFESGINKPEDTFSVLLANVLVDNKQSQSFLKIVQQQDPDILLAMEVDDWWANELHILKDRYPFFSEYPLDNAYGMILYSKLPMTHKEIRFLQHHDVPSFNVIIKLPSGKSFSFYAIHPVAPVPSMKYPDNVGKKPTALLKIGNLVTKNPLPALVAGDFNDVSWSNTSRIFGEQGNLKNVRIGRGLYNSFDANSWIMRWPLDHYFVTKEFKLVELKILSKFGSDHFPLFAKFVLDP